MSGAESRVRRRHWQTCALVVLSVTLMLADSSEHVDGYASLSKPIATRA